MRDADRLDPEVAELHHIVGPELAQGHLVVDAPLLQAAFRKSQRQTRAVNGDTGQAAA